MIVSVNQPAYFPWLGFFDRIARSDLYIVLDHVQFEKNSMTNRNKVRTAQGWSWLTVPVLTKNRFGCSIKDIEIDQKQAWRKKHLETLRQNYRRAPYFSRYMPYFEDLFSREWSRLFSVADEVFWCLLNELGLQREVVYSSTLSPSKSKSDLVLELCEKVGATTYLSGPFGRDYLDVDIFSRNGIAIEFHDYHHPSYKQCFPEFEPYMSVIDLLFNHGDRSLDIIRGVVGDD